jgi:hypothetical protein
VSPRRNRPSRAAGAAARAAGDGDGEPSYGTQRTEHAADGSWIVRQVTGAAATKTYRCPGCDQEIRPGVPHVVAWPSDDLRDAGLADRRHWHTPCWHARTRRAPSGATVRRRGGGTTRRR